MSLCSQKDCFLYVLFWVLMHLSICFAKMASYTFSLLLRKSLIFLLFCLVFDAFSNSFGCKIIYIYFWFASFQGFILWTMFCLFLVLVLKGKNKSYLALKHSLDPCKNVSGSKEWFRSIGKCVILLDYCYYD